MTSNMYTRGLDKCEANYVALTPLGFLERAASVYPDHTAVIDQGVRKTWGEIYRRCRRLASALAQNGIGKNDTVSIFAPNSLAVYECHFAVPMAGAVLNAINTRLDADTVAFILGHGEAKVLLVDAELAAVARAALAKIDTKLLVIDIEVNGIDTNNIETTDNDTNNIDTNSVATPADPLPAGSITYEDFLAGGDPEYPWHWPADEWDAISLNYTSGTTGEPKGVVYHHRGAYLNALSNIVGWQMPHHPVYLWTLPMFHCNGWCFPWSLAALAGVSVCLREVNAETINNAIADHRVTHFCGAPIIMNMLIHAGEAEQRARHHTRSDHKQADPNQIDPNQNDPNQADHKVNMMTAAAPPPAAVLAAMEAKGFRVTHVYGLTETYGPAVICAWQDDWNQLAADHKAQKNSRQGVRYHALEGLDVRNPENMRPVERNGLAMAETMFRGNIVMKGYLKNPETTARAFAGGWFHSGDLGVIHPDNYLQLKDRSKDIIISGGENISSIEVEDCLYRHPEIVDAAVVAKPDPKWGETPCAFVRRADGSGLTEQEIIDYCRENLAHFKAPRTVIFGDLPKTSTGKVQKFKLREAARRDTQPGRP